MKILKLDSDTPIAFLQLHLRSFQTDLRSQILVWKRKIILRRELKTERPSRHGHSVQEHLFECLEDPLYNKGFKKVANETNRAITKGLKTKTCMTFFLKLMK